MMKYIVDGMESAHGYCYCSAEYCGNERAPDHCSWHCYTECNQACPQRD